MEGIISLKLPSHSISRIHFLHFNSMGNLDSGPTADQMVSVYYNENMIQVDHTTIKRGREEELENFIICWI